ncbi:hypothetical protein OH77DRAFT_216028 [Trametes cingulata]|nr:hypothetical protein OH77DRAFT_216028 [Trametes cingulata]
MGWPWPSAGAMIITLADRWPARRLQWTLWRRADCECGLRDGRWWIASSADGRLAFPAAERDRGPRTPPVYSPRSFSPCQIWFGNSRAALWRSEADSPQERRQY